MGKGSQLKGQTHRGFVKSATIPIRDWLDLAELIVVKLDDHPMILDMDFLRTSGVMPIPNLKLIMLLSKKDLQNTIGGKVKTHEATKVTFFLLVKDNFNK